MEAESAARFVAKPVALEPREFQARTCSTLEDPLPGLRLRCWDKAGLLWQSIQEKWPDVFLVSAEPAKTLRLGKTVLMVEIKRQNHQL